MPLHQVLVYPVTTFAPEGEALESIQECANAMPLSAAALEWLGMHYLADPANATNPYASPLPADDLSGPSPVTMIQAVIDPLPPSTIDSNPHVALKGIGNERMVTSQSHTHRPAPKGRFKDAMARRAAARRDRFPDGTHRGRT